jgi:ABC-type Fe3+-hydroxamate transport system substrate-binding protein
MGLEAAAEAAIDHLQARIHAAVARVSNLKTPLKPPIVGFCEWTDPIFPGGHWTPQLIEMAGGCHPLNPCKEQRAAPSAAVTHEQFIEIDPDVIIIAPCGLDLKATKREMESLVGWPWWKDLRAVKEKRVWLVDGNQMFNRPGPRLIDALEWLVTILHECPEDMENLVATFPAEKLYV